MSVAVKTISLVLALVCIPVSVRAANTAPSTLVEAEADGADKKSDRKKAEKKQRAKKPKKKTEESDRTKRKAEKKRKADQDRQRQIEAAKKKEQEDRQRRDKELDQKKRDVEKAKAHVEASRHIQELKAQLEQERQARKDAEVARLAALRELDAVKQEVDKVRKTVAEQLQAIRAEKARAEELALVAKRRAEEAMAKAAAKKKAEDQDALKLRIEESKKRAEASKRKAEASRAAALKRLEDLKADQQRRAKESDRKPKTENTSPAIRDARIRLEASRRAAQEARRRTLERLDAMKADHERLLQQARKKSQPTQPSSDNRNSGRSNPAERARQAAEKARREAIQRLQQIRPPHPPQPGQRPTQNRPPHPPHKPHTPHQHDHASSTRQATEPLGIRLHRAISRHASVTGGAAMGKRRLDINEDQRHIHVENQNGAIKILVIEKGENSERTSQYHASDIDQLRKNHPEGYQLYQQLKAKGFLKPSKNAKIQTTPGRVTRKTLNSRNTQVDVEADVEIELIESNDGKIIRRGTIRSTDDAPKAKPDIRQYRLQLAPDGGADAGKAPQIRVEVDAQADGDRPRVFRKTIRSTQESSKAKPTIREYRLQLAPDGADPGKTPTFRFEVDPTPEGKSNKRDGGSGFRWTPKPIVAKATSDKVRQGLSKSQLQIRQARRDILKRHLEVLKNSQDDATKKLIDSWIKQLD